MPTLTQHLAGIPATLPYSATGKPYEAISFGLFALMIVLMIAFAIVLVYMEAKEPRAPKSDTEDGDGVNEQDPTFVAELAKHKRAEHIIAAVFILAMVASGVGAYIAWYNSAVALAEYEKALPQECVIVESVDAIRDEPLFRKFQINYVDGAGDRGYFTTSDKHTAKNIAESGRVLLVRDHGILYLANNQKAG